MKYFFVGMALVVGSVSVGVTAPVRADDGPTVAEVTRSPSFDLLVQEFKNVTISEVQVRDHDRYGNPATGVTSASIEFNMLVIPRGCNTSYYRDEILARIQGHESFRDVNPIMKVDFGLIDEIGVLSTCVGLPPRPAHLKLDLLNGIDATFGQDRVFTFQFDGPANALTHHLEQWIVRVNVNQATGKIEVAPIVRKNDEPVIPAAYIQNVQCDTLDRRLFVGVPSDKDRLNLVITKVAGDVADGKNYSVAIEGTSKSIFGPDSGPQQLKLIANPHPPKMREPTLLSLIDPSRSPILEAQLDTRNLGWKVNRPFSLEFKSGEKVFLASCTVTDMAQ
ncbi:hypothetical protein WDW37_01200 [Bdellovibrionota bacterium FG-1]